MKFGPILSALVVVLGGSTGAGAQVSLPTAVNLALQNSPKVRMAEADLGKAKAVLAETKDAFIPALSATGGVGRASGAPLSPPVVFSIAAQSLVFNFSQPDYIRAAHSSIASAQLAVEAARADVAEDATSTYVALDNALNRHAVLQQAFGHASRLATVTEDRFNAGVDPHIEVTKAQRTAAQIHLQELLVEDEIAEDADHLADLTGMPAAGLTTVSASIPALRPPAEVAEDARADRQTLTGTSAAFEAARAKDYTAHGQSRYLLRPQLSFSVQYSRLSDAFSSYDFYYPGFHERILCTPVCRVNGTFNSFNSLGVGVQLTLPLLDMVHRARAREAALDAQRSFLEAQQQQDLFLETRHKLEHSTRELAARAKLAALDHDLSEDQLQAVAVRLQAGAGTLAGEQMTPKDEENARLAERLRSVDVLNAELELRRAEISLLRQGGSLANWLAAALPGTTAAVDRATPENTPITPPAVGVAPGAASPPGSIPPVGAIPPALPSAPVTNPAPGAPPEAPQPHP